MSELVFEHMNKPLYDFYEKRLRDSNLGDPKVDIVPKLNDLFGPFGWSETIVESAILQAPEYDKKSDCYVSVSYARVKLEIHPTGDVLCWRSASSSNTKRGVSPEASIDGSMEEAERKAFLEAALSLVGVSGRKRFPEKKPALPVRSKADSPKSSKKRESKTDKQDGSHGREEKKPEYPWLKSETKRDLHKAYTSTDPRGTALVDDLLRQAIEEDAWVWACQNKYAVQADGLELFVAAGFENKKIPIEVSVNALVDWMKNIKSMAALVDEKKAKAAKKAPEKSTSSKKKSAPASKSKSRRKTRK